jgi:succinate dehydrogenase/fumarate reductase iron-sulfur protein
VGLVKLRVLRSAGFTEYEVEPDPGMTILDALEVIRRTREPGLRYRHSCHHGSCGTCAGLVDGKERLLCLTALAGLGPGPVTVEPLRKMGLVGDLAVDPTRFFAELPAGAGYLRPSSRRRDGDGTEHPDGARAMELEACIECGICVSACPVAAPFVGPAALAAADTDRQSNPEREEASLVFASGPRGVDACERAFACSRACPQGVDPGRRIARLRRSLKARPSSR